MDFKRYFPLMLLGLLLVVGWPVLMDRIARHYNWSSPKNLKPAPAQPIETTTSPVEGEQKPGRWTVVSSGEAREVTIGSAVPRNQKFTLALQLNSIGAGIDSVTLNQFKQKLNSEEPYTFGKPYEGFESHTRMLATRGVVIDGEFVDLSNANWTHVSDSSDDPKSQQSLWSLTLADNGVPSLEIQKRFEVFEKDARQTKLSDDKFGDGPEGYESIVRHTFINKTDRKMSIALVVNGTHTPPAETDYAGPGTFQTGFEDREIITVESHNAGSIKAETTDLFHSKHESKKPTFIGTVSTYFATVVRPIPAEGAKPHQYLASANAISINPEVRGIDHHVDLSIQTKPFQVNAGAETFFKFAVYFGPKKREIMGNDYYTSLGVNEVMVVTQGICAVCTFDWLIQILFVVLRAFHAVVQDWGISIIMLVLLVRLLLHPVTKFSQLNMLKLSKFGPELKKLQEKYKDDKDGYARAQMQMMRQQGAGPFMGCLPMFAQMPIWIAMWQAMQTTFELRHAPFLYGFTWIDDLSKPDHLLDFAEMGIKPINLGIIVISGLNLLPVLLAIVFYIQTRITPQPQATTPEQEQQQKIMKWMMVFMFPLFLYGQPSGLCLYTLTSTIVGIIESKLIRKKFERNEALAAKFKIEEEESGVQKVVAKKKSGLSKWMEEKMKQIDAIQKAAQEQKSSQDRKKKRD